MEPIKDWFGFSRRERRSTFILLVLTCIVFTFRYALPETDTEIENLTDRLPRAENKLQVPPSGINSDHPFHFNPNTVSYDTLLKLGLGSKAAGTLIKYRNRGGKFRNPSDLRKVYGIDSSRAEKLIPYVNVKKDTSVKTGNGGYRSKRKQIEINGCDSATLVSLPGIGPVLASRIIKYRRLLGGYVSVNQLREVYGLPSETYEMIEERLTVDTLSVSRININSGGFKELVKIPYLEKFEVSSILKYRKLKGRIKGIADLTENKLVAVEKAGKIKGYLRFE